MLLSSFAKECMTWYDYDHDWLYSSSNLVYRITIITCKYCTLCIANVVTRKDLSPLCFPGHLHSARHCERGGSTAPCDWPVMACHHILATAAARERQIADEAFSRCSRRSSSESWKDLERYWKIELLMGQRRWVAAKICMGSTDGTWKMQSNMISCN